jgi:hypothetical protein
LASFNDKENLIEVSEEIKEILQDDLKDTVRPSEKSESPVVVEAPPESKDEKKEAEQTTPEPPAKETKPQVSVVI